MEILILGAFFAWNVFLTYRLAKITSRPPIIHTGEVINNYPKTVEKITYENTVLKDGKPEEIKDVLVNDYYFMESVANSLNNLQLFRR